MNKTPRAIAPLEIAAARALSAAMELGPILDLRANDAATLGPVVHDLYGRPGDPAASPPLEAIPGKQPLYSKAQAAHADARATLRAATADGRAFVMQAVNTLKGLLGNRWNPNWISLGFTSGSLELPRHPLPILPLLAAYYRRHLEHEAASLNLTAARAEQVRTALLSAMGAADAAKTAEKEAKKSRDAAFQKLRLRIMGLREELRCLLGADDYRWHRFGFRRPADSGTPDPVEELNVRLGRTGEVIVEWTPAPRAENYRLSWKEAGAVDAEPTLVGLFADPRTIVTGLPAGRTITLMVTARNGARKSAPREASIALPPAGETQTSRSQESCPEGRTGEGAGEGEPLLAAST